MITRDRIRQLIEDHDRSPVKGLGGLNYYLTYMKILLESNGIKGFHEFDYDYTERERHEMFKETDKLLMAYLGI